MQPSLDDSILQPYGGFHNNSLVDIIRLDDDLSNANEQLQTITHSSYYDHEKFTNCVATGILVFLAAILSPSMLNMQNLNYLLNSSNNRNLNLVQYVYRNVG